LITLPFTFIPLRIYHAQRTYILYQKIFETKVVVLKFLSYDQFLNDDISVGFADPVGLILDQGIIDKPPRTTLVCISHTKSIRNTLSHLSYETRQTDRQTDDYWLAITCLLMHPRTNCIKPVSLCIQRQFILSTLQQCWSIHWRYMNALFMH